MNANHDERPSGAVDQGAFERVIRDNLSPAGVRRAAMPTAGERTMRYRIELADDLLQVLDEDGHGHDAHVVCKDGADAAQRKIDEWAAEYGIDPRPAKRDVRDLIRRM